MNLIEEIETARNTYLLTPERSTFDTASAYRVISSAWWPRIKAALEAAQEMSVAGDDLDHRIQLASKCPFCLAQSDFHANYDNL